MGIPLGSPKVKTVILLKNFSFGFIDFVYLSTTFFIERLFGAF